MMIVSLNVFHIRIVLINYPLFQHAIYHYNRLFNNVSSTFFKTISLQIDVNHVKERSISLFDLWNFHHSHNHTHHTLVETNFTSWFDEMSKG